MDLFNITKPFQDISTVTLLGQETVESVNATLLTMEVLDGNLTKVILPVIYIIILIVGLPANGLAFWVFLFREKKTPGFILMANLALADLFLIICLPLKILYHFNGNNWTFGEPLCKALVGFFYGSMYCSTTFIACLCVERYWTIRHLFSTKLKSRAVMCVSVCVWLMIWLITIPLYMYNQTVKVTNLNITTCHDVTRPSQSHILAGYLLTMGILGYVIPCMTCIVSYVMRFHFLWNSMKGAKDRLKTKVLIIMTIKLLVFLMCFTPSNIMLMVHYSQLTAGFQNNVYDFYIFSLCLPTINSCVDPFVYYFRLEDFRDHVTNVIRCRSERTAQRKKVRLQTQILTSKQQT